MDSLLVIDWLDMRLSTRGVARGVTHTIIMQRLHENDLAGHILKRGGYVHVCLPMRFEPNRMGPTPLGWTDERTEEGELLTPEQFPEEAVADMEKALGAYGTAGQLQQRPRPKSGGMFKEQWFRHRRKAAPYEAKRIRSWDRASSTTESACFTAGVLMAQDEKGNYYVEDVVHGKWEPDERNNVMRATALRDRSKYGPSNEPRIYVEAEGGSSGRDAWKGVARALDGFPVWEDRVTGKKDVRAEPWAAQLAAGNVYIVDNGEMEGTGKATWDINGFIREHLMFKPDVTSSRLGRLKDVVDASSSAYNLFVNQPRVQAPRIYSFKKDDPVKKLRLLVCTAEELESFIEDNLRCLLVTVRDPLDEPSEPLHGVRRMVGVHAMAFADLDPKDHQTTWDKSVPPYDLPAGKLVLSPESARDMWKFLLKRDRAYEAIIFQGSSDRRAYSLACGVADALGISRKSCLEVLSAVDISIEGIAANQHVIDQVKTARGRLLM
jgi:predicted phage terminase large subunit-like protein